MLEILRFDASRCGFPVPQVPGRAPFTARAWRRRAAGPGLTDGRPRHCWHFRRGRYALREAFRLAGLGPGQTVLVPAYHCRSMLDPALALGAAIVLYPVHPDLSPDLAALQALVREHAPGLRAMLVSHFFGFAQPLAPVLAFCRAHGIELIEDCAHGLVVDPALARQPELGAGMGRTARLGVASPFKFLPGQDGGLLWVDDDLVGARPVLTAPPCAVEARAAAVLLREVVVPRPAHGGQMAGADAAHPTGPAQHGSERIEALTGPAADYLAAEQGWTNLASSRWVMARADLGQIADLRRRRYRQWAQAVATVPGCNALLPDLPEHTVPCMFPLLLAEPQRAFAALKRAGLPIGRWDSLARSACPVAGRYRTSLLHLPCHQGLSDAQWQWMADTLRSVMSAQAPSPSGAGGLE